MKLDNCQRCGKVFGRVGRSICPDCLAEEEKLFLKIREFLEENPGLTVQEVAKTCEVDPMKIYDFLKMGRLQAISFASNSAQWQCESCNSPITTGRLCNKCSSLLQQEAMRQSAAPKFTEVKPLPGKTAVGKIHISRWRDR